MTWVGTGRIGAGITVLAAAVAGTALLASSSAFAEPPADSVEVAGAARAAPSVPAGQSSVLSAGNVYACAIADGHLTCWGSDADMGRVADTPTTEQFADVAAGPDATCAIRTDGTLACWGATAMRNPPAGQFTSVSVNSTASCAIRIDGTLACWGTSETLTQPPAGAFTAVAMGANSACAIDATGVLQCWGASVSINGDAAVAIESGSLDSFCAIGPDGSLTCSTGFPVPPTNGPYTSLGLNGSSSACATRATGELDCWAVMPSDAIVADQPAGQFSSVSGHVSGMCAMPSDGVPVCWGQARATQGLAPLLVATCAAGQVGVPYADSDAHYDSTAVVPWFDRFVVTGGSLPPGLVMDPATGQFAGVPTQPGSFPVEVTARNVGSPAATASCTVNVEPGVAAGIALTPPTASVKVGQSQAYSVHLVTTTGVPMSDVSDQASVAIGAGAQCDADGCWSDTPGTYAVTATYLPGDGGEPWTATAELIVEANAPTPPSPPPSTPTGPSAGPTPGGGAAGGAPSSSGSALANTGGAALPLTLLAMVLAAVGGGVVAARRRVPRRR